MSRIRNREIKKIVIKVGSSLIANYQLKPKRAMLSSLVSQISRISHQGKQVVLVSSGAIVLGMGELNERIRPTDLASLQARAAIGQAVLMRMYSDLFKKNKSKCAQVLLTWEDFDARLRYNNARNTFLAILERGVIPIVNENDTISTDEIKFGDNDKLSALVAGMIRADLLLILSDVEGLMDLKRNDKKVFDEIHDVTDEIKAVASSTTKKHISKGGMSAKLEAVKLANHAHVPCIIAHGETPNILPRILNGERIGTFFVEKDSRGSADLHPSRNSGDIQWVEINSKNKKG